MLNRILLALPVLVLVCACGDGGSSEDSGDTSHSPTGGTGLGGELGVGGGPATGATASTGATTAGALPTTGGALSTGGLVGTGGAATTGGGEAITGGASPTGGVMPTGGATPTGGAVATGGVSTGGASATGGVLTTGGAPGTGGTTSTPGCDRAGLTAAVDGYLAALQAGDPSSLPLAASATYTVNEASETLAAGAGLFESAMTIDFHRSLIDVTRCGSFTEIIAATNDPQYVLGTKLMVADGEISEIEVVATWEGHWGFDADAYLQYSSGEDWSIVPEGERLPYDELAEVGYLYFEYWADRTVVVPWGVPCARLEGGMYTGDFANSSCDVGIPDEGFAPQPREHLVDVDYGMSVVLLNLGGADSHLFRQLNTGIRYVHTLTAMEQTALP